MYKSAFILVAILALTCEKSHAAFFQSRQSTLNATVYTSLQTDPLDLPWTSLESASCPTGTRSACRVYAQAFSEVFEAKTFGFSVPERGNITGISVTWHVQVSTEINPRTREISVSLIRGTVSVEEFPTQPFQYASNEGWNSSVGSVSYPLPIENRLWNTIWTVSQLNSPDFGVRMRIENPSGGDIDAFVHCITISVEYEEELNSLTSVGTSDVVSTTTEIGFTTSDTPRLSSDVVIVVPSSSVNDMIITEYAVFASLSVVAFLALLSLVSYFIYVKTRKRRIDNGDERRHTFARGQSILRMSNVYVDGTVVIGKRLGGGRYGDVFMAKLNGSEIACKRMKNTSGTSELEKEVRILVRLKHPNIVTFFGIYQSHISRELYIAMEYFPSGSLSTFLKMNMPLKTGELVSMALGVAGGMNYLEEQKVVHRDLAARNLLVIHSDGVYQAKIADFGMGLEIDEGNYEPTGSSALPVKWSAPEVMNKREYTTKSDVWSFGVVLWEMFSRGETPYTNLTNKQTIDKIERGERLEKPDECPDVVYELMMDCWKTSATKRPTFSDIHSRIYKISDRPGGDTVTEEIIETIESDSVTPDYYQNETPVPGNGLEEIDESTFEGIDLGSTAKEKKGSIEKKKRHKKKRRSSSEKKGQ